MHTLRLSGPSVLIPIPVTVPDIQMLRAIHPERLLHDPRARRLHALPPALLQQRAKLLSLHLLLSKKGRRVLGARARASAGSSPFRYDIAPVYPQCDQDVDDSKGTR